MGRQISKYVIHGLQPIIRLYKRPARWLPSGHRHIINVQMGRKRGTQERGSERKARPLPSLSLLAPSLILFSGAFGGSTPHLIQVAPQPQTWLVHSPPHHASPALPVPCFTSKTPFPVNLHITQTQNEHNFPQREENGEVEIIKPHHLIS